MKSAHAQPQCVGMVEERVGGWRALLLFRRAFFEGKGREAGRNSSKRIYRGAAEIIDLPQYRLAGASAGRSAHSSSPTSIGHKSCHPASADAPTVWGNQQTPSPKRCASANECLVGSAFAAIHCPASPICPASRLSKSLRPQARRARRPIVGPPDILAHRQEQEERPLLSLLASEQRTP